MAKELISRRIKKTGIYDDKQTYNFHAGARGADGQLRCRRENAGILLRRIAGKL